ncbi:hypothetical protein ACHAPU_009137 [Fusarium lateritium]
MSIQSTDPAQVDSMVTRVSASSSATDLLGHWVSPLMSCTCIEMTPPISQSRTSLDRTHTKSPGNAIPASTLPIQSTEGYTWSTPSTCQVEQPRTLIPVSFRVF